MQKVVDPHLLAYNDTWNKVDAMLTRIMDEAFRTRCATLRRRMDLQLVLRRPCGLHVNPRRRDMGYHNVFEHYKNGFETTRSRNQDGLHFHYHPHSFRK